MAEASPLALGRFGTASVTGLIEFMLEAGAGGPERRPLGTGGAVQSGTGAGPPVRPGLERPGRDPDAGPGAPFSGDQAGRP